MDMSPIEELEALRADLQQLLDAEAARGVVTLPRPTAEQLQAPAPQAAPARPSQPTRTAPSPGERPSQPRRRPAGQQSAKSPSQTAAPRREAPVSRTPTTRKRRPGAGSKWGGSPSSPKKPQSPLDLPPDMGMDMAPPPGGDDMPPPPEMPDWLEEAEQPPPGPLPERPRFKRPNKKDIRYTWDHVVGSWGFRQNQLPPIPGGSPASQAADRLLAVRKELGECERCGLCERSKSVVFGMGNPAADLVIVGEGPGAQEDQRGLPFVGPAGEMLDKMLAGVLGLSRSQVYILNIVKCRPPRNRDPLPEEIAACRPFLDAQLRALKPKVILALGSPASKTLLQTDEGIMRLRGSWHERDGVPLRPTLHPAYLLRRPQDKRKALEDLVAVKERLTSGGS